MSQHFFKAQLENREVSCLTGWDRPLGGFFLVVENLNPSDDDENGGLIYSHLGQKESYPREYDQFADYLKSVGIRMPNGLMEALLEDRDSNAGNIQVTWSLGS